MNEQPTLEQQVEFLEAKLKDYKIRIFDMAEHSEELNKALQAQQQQTQEFVTAVMRELKMELTNQVMLSDVITVLNKKLAPVEKKLDTEE